MVTRGGGDGVDNANYRHGMTGTATYHTYNGMIQRCYNPNSEHYKDYGGRGIYVDPHWVSFTKFLEDMGEKPEGMQLDRIDNDGPYSKENCRWVTPQQNCSNTRRNVTFLYDGEILTISEIARRTNIHIETLRSRLKAGHTLEEAIAKVKWSK